MIKIGFLWKGSKPDKV